MAFNNNQPTLNVIAIEEEDRTLKGYYTCRYNNPQTNGLPTSAFIWGNNYDTIKEKIIELIMASQEEGYVIKSEFDMPKLEDLAKKGKTEVQKHPDGRVRILNRYYRDNILD